MAREDHDRLGTADLVTDAGERHEMPLEHHARREDPQALHQERADRPHLQPPPQGDWARQDAAMHAQPLPPQGLHAQDMTAQRTLDPQPDPSPGDLGMRGDEQQLAALFPPEVADKFRQRWDNVQIGFVDDPNEAVRHADELVAEVMQHLAASFAGQRSRLGADVGQAGQTNTEHLRMALRGYRSFFQRLLSL